MARNVAFGLEMRKVGRAERDRKVAAALDLVGLSGFAERYPRRMSGGQQQRVALARALVIEPSLLLLDEPLSNLDAALRVQTRIEIAKLHDRMKGTTMIYVTHDQVEAMTLADRIVVLNKGRIEQVGSPMELYARPDNLFVARFIGSPAMNIVPASALSASLNLPGGTVHVGVRPEDLSLAEAGEGILSGTIKLIEPLGEVTLAYVDIGGGEEPVVVKLQGNRMLERGATVSLAADPGKLHAFDTQGHAIR